MQIVSTICCAYLSFFVAEYNLEISGVLSCVTAGMRRVRIMTFLCHLCDIFFIYVHTRVIFSLSVLYTPFILYNYGT